MLSQIAGYMEGTNPWIANPNPIPNTGIGQYKSKYNLIKKIVFNTGFKALANKIAILEFAIQTTQHLTYLG